MKNKRQDFIDYNGLYDELMEKSFLYNILVMKKNKFSET